MSTKGIIRSHIGSGCQFSSLIPGKYTVLNGNFVFDLRDFNFRGVFQGHDLAYKRIASVK